MHIRSPLLRVATRRAGGAALLCAAALVTVAGPASAHVTVSPGSAVAGSDAELTFQVPDESAKASTTRVELDLPLDHPIGSVAFRPVPGWSAKVTLSHLAKPVVTDEATVTDAVSKVVWSGGQIRPDEYQSFAVDAGPIPDGIKRLPFTVVQTYSDGTVVRWADPTPASGEEPEHPAPTIAVQASDAAASPAPAASSASAAPPASAAPSAAPASSSAPASASTGSDGLARAGAALALVAAVVALVLAARRRPAG